MSEKTESALELLTKKWMWVEDVLGAWHFQGIPNLDQAAAELAQIQNESEGRKIIIDNVIHENDKLRTALEDAKKVVALAHKTLASIPIGAVQVCDVGYVLGKLGAFIEAHPADKETK